MITKRVIPVAVSAAFGTFISRVADAEASRPHESQDYVHPEYPRDTRILVNLGGEVVSIRVLLEHYEKPIHPCQVVEPEWLGATG